MDSPVDVIAFTDTAKAIAPWGREMRSHFGKDRRDRIHDTETRSHFVEKMQIASSRESLRIAAIASLTCLPTFSLEMPILLDGSG